MKLKEASDLFTTCVCAFTLLPLAVPWGGPFVQAGQSAPSQLVMTDFRKVNKQCQRMLLVQDKVRTLGRKH